LKQGSHTQSVTSIAIINIVAFSLFYTSYIRLYLSDKIDSRKDVTIEYINNIIERQSLEDIDNIFSDVEIEFFELLDLWDGKISLEDDANVNVVVDFLLKSWVSAKYIEEIIPENNLEKVLFQLRQSDSPESTFIKRLIYSLIVTNIIILAVFASVVLFFTKRIIVPIKNATSKIKNLKPGKVSHRIDYPKKDEIWLLIESINGLNSRLSMQEKIRSRLLADISHELKTPITSIQCYLEGIHDGVIKLDDTSMQSITDEMTRLIELVNKIMEYEKFESSEIILDKRVHNPYDIINSVCDTFVPKLHDMKQTISLEGSKNIELFLDKDLFTQVVYNLVWNFHKYAWEKTRLTIEIKAKSIIFSDNGKWISSKEVPLIFEKFYQGKKEKTWNISARGIWVGLSVVKKVVDAHGWNTQVKSKLWSWFAFEIIF